MIFVPDRPGKFLLKIHTHCELEKMVYDVLSICHLHQSLN